MQNKSYSNVGIRLVFVNLKDYNASMNTEGFPKVENTNQSREIIFNGNDKETDVFNYRLDLKLEDCRERMEEISSAIDGLEDNQEYLNLKYFLHIANAIRFKKGADYDEIYLSLKKQGGEIKDQIFEKVWLMLEDYVNGGWERNKGFFSFFKKENNDSLIIERIDVSYDKECQLIWAKIYKDKTKKIIWHKTGMAAFKESSQGKLIVRNIDNVVRLEDFLHSQFGDNKKLNIAKEIK